MVPSLRLIVPSSEDFTPLPAFGVPLVRSTGQADAQAPEQADWFGWSLLNTYSVRPLPPTRIGPRLLCEVETVAAPVCEGALEAPPPPPP